MSEGPLSFLEKLEASGTKVVEDPNIPEGTAIMGDRAGLIGDGLEQRGFPRLWDSEPKYGVTHIAGGCIVICNRYMRQRCEWCGIVLIEYDLQNVAVHSPDDPNPSTLPAHWRVGGMVRVDGNMSAEVENPPVVDGDVQLPPDSCCFDPKTQVRKS